MLLPLHQNMLLGGNPVLTVSAVTAQATADATAFITASGGTIVVDVPTTFAEAMEEDCVSLFAYVYVEGIPIVFSNVNQPTEWTLATGWTWSNSCVFFRTRGASGLKAVFGTVSQEMDFDEGLVRSGDLQVEFLLDTQDDAGGTWIGSLLAPISRTIKAIEHRPPIRPSRRVIAVLDDTGMAPGQTWWHGNEAMTIAQLTLGENAIEVNRGAFGSTARWIGNTGPDGADAGYPELTDWPRSWRNRLVRIYLEASRIDDVGLLQPLSTTPAGPAQVSSGATHSKEIFRGPLRRTRWGAEMASFRFRVQSLEQLLEQPAVTRARRYLAGPRPELGTGWVYLENDGTRYVEIDGGEAWIDLLAASGAGAGSVDHLIRIGLGGTGDPLADSIRGLDELATTIVSEANAHFVQSTTYRWNFEWRVNAEGKVEFTVEEIRAGTQGIPGNETASAVIVFRFESATNPDQSAWPALGITTDLTLSQSGALSVGTAQEIPPHYYVGVGSTRVYWHYETPGSGVQDPPQLQGTIDLEGNSDRPAIRFGNHEILRLNFHDAFGRLNSTPTAGSAVRYYGEVTRRGVLNTSVGRITVAADAIDSDDNRLVLGLAFNAHALMPTLLQLAISNGDPSSPVSSYNVLPEGYGAAIPPDAFDIDAFVRVQFERQPVSDNLWIEDDEPLRGLFATVAKAFGLALFPKFTSTGYKISVIEAAPPPLLPVSGIVIDQSWTDTMRQPAEPERDESSVVNTIEFEFNWDPLTRQYASRDNSYRHTQSLQREGGSRSIKVELPWLSGLTSVRVVLDPLASYLFARFGEPPVRYIVPVLRAEAWALELNDRVALTHPLLPNLRGTNVDGSALTSPVGLVNEPVIVVQAKHEFGPGARRTSTLTLEDRSTTDSRFTTYAPSLAIESIDVSDAFGQWYDVRTNFLDGGFSAEDDRDIDHYANAATGRWKVRGFLRGRDDYQDRIINGIDLAGERIRVESSFTGVVAANITLAVIEFDTYAEAGDLADEQEVHVFMGDEETLQLTNASAETRSTPRWY